MKSNSTFLMSLIATVIIMQIIIKNVVVWKLNKYLSNSQYEEYESLKSSGLARMFVGPVKFLVYDLSKALLQNDDEKILQILKTVDAGKMENKQKKEIYSRCFHYFISENNKDGSSMVYEIIKKFGDEELLHDANIYYDTYINKGSKYLNDLLDQLNDDDTSIAKATHETIISEIYKNIGDIDNERRYVNLAKNHLSEMISG